MGFNLGIALGSAANTGLETYLKLKKQKQENARFEEEQQQRDARKKVREGVAALPAVGAANGFAGPDGNPIVGKDQVTADQNALLANGKSAMDQSDTQSWGRDASMSQPTAIPVQQNVAGPQGGINSQTAMVPTQRGPDASQFDQAGPSLATPKTYSVGDRANDVANLMDKSGVDPTEAMKMRLQGAQTQEAGLSVQDKQFKMQATQAAVGWLRDVQAMAPTELAKKYAHPIEAAAASQGEHIIIDPNTGTFQGVDTKTGAPVGEPQKITSAQVSKYAHVVPMLMHSASSPEVSKYLVEATQGAQKIDIERQRVAAEGKHLETSDKTAAELAASTGEYHRAAAEEARGRNKTAIEVANINLDRGLAVQEAKTEMYRQGLGPGHNGASAQERREALRERLHQAWMTGPGAKYDEQIAQLDPNRPADKAQIANLRQQAEMSFQAAMQRVDIPADAPAPGSPANPGQGPRAALPTGRPTLGSAQGQADPLGIR